MHIKIKAFFAVSLFTCVVAASPSLQAATPEESFRKNFPDISVESVAPTAITGVFEIVSGGKIAYYAPGPGYLIIGQLITPQGTNLTQARNTELQGQKFKDLPLDKALKIGSGSHTVIEITDPDCPFCRKASEYFATRGDVTRYVFFYPIADLHPQAEAKVRYVFCAKDRVKAYEEAMSGKLDDMKFTVCDDAAALALANAHQQIGDKIGIAGLGTPMFVVDGQFVRGADIPQIEKILGAQK